MNTRRVHKPSATGRWRVLGSVGLVLVAAALPKCPLCIALYLTAFGVSATAATLVAPWLPPTVWAAAVSGGVYVCVRLLRSRVTSSRVRSSDDAHDGNCCR